MEGSDEYQEFFKWIEGQTFQMRRQQGRLSTFSETDRQSAFQQVVALLRVPLDIVQESFRVMRKEHRDPTLSELADRIREQEAKQMDGVMERHKHQLIKQVHKDTLVSKTDIEIVYNGMLDVNARLPTRETLAMQVRTTYYNSYPHLRVKPLTGP
jgi:hypothetical protein